MGEIWERQEKEGIRAYEAFCYYRDLGTGRSLDKAYQRYLEIKKGSKDVQGKRAPAKWREWSVKHHWVERVKAYDEYLERERRRINEEEIFEMYRQHALIANGFQEKIVKRLNTMDVEELSPSDMAKWFDVATRVERISKGEPVEILREKTEVNLSGNISIKYTERVKELINELTYQLAEQSDASDELIPGRTGDIQYKGEMEDGKSFDDDK